MELQKQSPDCSKFLAWVAPLGVRPAGSELELALCKPSRGAQHHHEQKSDGEIIRNGHSIVPNMSIPDGKW